MTRTSSHHMDQQAASEELRKIASHLRSLSARLTRMREEITTMRFERHERRDWIELEKVADSVVLGLRAEGWSYRRIGVLIDRSPEIVRRRVFAAEKRRRLAEVRVKKGSAPCDEAPVPDTSGKA